MKIDKRGFSTIAIVLVIVSILAVFAAVSMSRSQQGAGAARYSHGKHLANYAADAGLRYAVRRLADVDTWNPGSDDVTRVSLLADGSVLYSVRVLDNRAGSSPLAAPDGQAVEPGQAYIRSLGEVRNGSAGNLQSNARSKGAIAVPGTPMFNYSMVADQKLEIREGCVVDSYNTEQVALSNPLFVQQYSPLTTWNNFLSNGHVLCNDVGNNVLVRNSSVYGQVSVKSGTPRYEGDYRVGPAGSYTRTETPVHRPPYSPSQATTDVVVHVDEVKMIPPGAYRSITVHSRGILLLDMVAGGLNQFYVKDTVNIQNGGLLPIRLTAPGDSLQLYIGKKLECNLGWINPFGRPSQMSVMFVGDGLPNSKSDLEMKGSQAWMLVSGGSTTVKIKDSSHLFGAVKARQVELSNASCTHYDVALRSKPQLGLAEWRYRVVSDSSPSIETEVAASGAQPTAPPPSLPPNNPTAVAPQPPVTTTITDPATLPSVSNGPLPGEILVGSPPNPLPPIVPVPGGFVPLPPGIDPNIYQVTVPYIPVVAGTTGGAAGGSGTTTGGAVTTGGGSGTTTGGAATTGGGSGTTTAGTATTGGGSGTTTAGTTTGGTTSGGTTTGGATTTTTGGTSTGGTTTGGTSGGGPWNPDPPAGYDDAMGTSGTTTMGGLPYLYSFVLDYPGAMSGYYRYELLSP